MFRSSRECDRRLHAGNVLVSDRSVVPSGKRGYRTRKGSPFQAEIESGRMVWQVRVLVHRSTVFFPAHKFHWKASWFITFYFGCSVKQSEGEYLVSLCVVTFALRKRTGEPAAAAHGNASGRHSRECAFRVARGSLDSCRNEGARYLGPSFMFSGVRGRWPWLAWHWVGSSLWLLRTCCYSCRKVSAITVGRSSCGWIPEPENGERRFRSGKNGLWRSCSNQCSLKIDYRIRESSIDLIEPIPESRPGDGRKVE